MRNKLIGPGPGQGDAILIGMILFIAAILRFWRLPEIPFTYDEFSALFRTQFNSFHEVIEKGVKIDTHPAGIQVFLYYLVKWFGSTEAVIKTPFILFGLASVWLVFRIGRVWFSSATGLVAASFLAFLQYPVMYSQIARPYASGLFFCLLLTWFWTLVIFRPDRKYYANLAGFVISASLCTYNHHFSLLFAAMAGITGLILCPKGRRISYLLAGVTVIILYLPHLPVFFAQLKMGGVEGWLQKPRWDFIADYLQYAFHFSYFVYGLLLVLIIFQLLWRNKVTRLNRTMLLVSLVWFLIPYLAGFFYSRYVNAVLQYSVLIFSFPFLLFIAFGYFKTDRFLHKALLVFLVAVVTIPSLIIERRHYRIFYRSPYREMLTESKNACDSLGKDRCTVLLETKAEINRWYLARYRMTSFRHTPVSRLNGMTGFRHFVDSCKTDFLAYGCTSYAANENYPVILERFPYLLKHETYAGGNFYLFSKKPARNAMNEYSREVVNEFEPSNPDWGWVSGKKCTDSLAISGKLSYDETNGDSYSPTYIASLRSLVSSNDDLIDISAEMRLPVDFTNARLVASITSDGRDVAWVSSQVRDYVQPGHCGTVHLSVRISDVEMRHHRLKFTSLVWNAGNQKYILDRYTIRVRSGNPEIYGLYRRVTE